jgi:hypothetical protein
LGTPLGTPLAGLAVASMQPIRPAMTASIPPRSDCGRTQPTPPRRGVTRRSLTGVPTRGAQSAYRVPAASPLRSFSLARHFHGATGALSAHRPRGAARARSRNTTGQSTLRCPAQREITSVANGSGQRARRRRFTR